MPRPTNKAELIAAAETQFAKLWQLINGMSGAMQQAAFQFGEDFLQQQKEAHWARDKNVRDILVHLYEWHRLLLVWVEANQNGEPKPFLPAPYNWKTYAQMNIGFWEKHQATPCAQARELLQASHKQVMALVERYTDAELFEKRHFPWTSATNLASYCISATSSHYDWALKKLKIHGKTYQI